MTTPARATGTCSCPSAAPADPRRDPAPSLPENRRPPVMPAGDTTLTITANLTAHPALPHTPPPAPERLWHGPAAPRPPAPPAPAVLPRPRPGSPWQRGPAAAPNRPDDQEGSQVDAPALDGPPGPASAPAPGPPGGAGLADPV